MNNYAKLSASMALWGTIGLFVLWSGLDGMTIAFYRCLFGALVLIALTRGPLLSGLKQYSRKDLLLMMLGGVFVVLNWVLLFKAFQLASITLGNVAYYVQPIFLVMLGIVFFSEKVALGKWLFIALTFVGIILSIDIKFQDWSLGNSTLLGTGYALLAGLLYAIATVIAKMQKHVEAKHMTVVQLLTGVVLLLPIMSSTSWHLTAPQWGYILIIGVVHTALAYILFYDAVKTISVTAVAVISYLDPIIAIMTDVVFFQRQLVLIQWVGIALTLWASYKVLTYREKRLSNLASPAAIHQP